MLEVYGVLNSLIVNEAIKDAFVLNAYRFQDQCVIEIRFVFLDNFQRQCVMAYEY